jgi:hypothetical protein
MSFFVPEFGSVSLILTLCRYSGWRKRYFILENGVLMYYMNANSPHCKGSVNLLTSVVVVPKKDSHRFEIDTGVGILHLRAKVHFLRRKKENLKFSVVH